MKKDYRDLPSKLESFEGSDDLGNGDFSICTDAATAIAAMLAENAITTKIAHQLYKAVSKYTDDPEILCILGSYRGTLDDTDILCLLENFKATGTAMRERRYDA